MTITAIVLLIISAATHSGWNLIGKKSPTAGAFLLASVSGVMLLLPVFIVFHGVTRFFTPRVWLYLFATGACQALYYGTLAAAYRRSDMSLVYPVARSTPAIIVSAFALIVGRSGNISALALAGILLIVVGGYLLPMKHFRNFSLGNYLNSSILFALLAAVGTSGYSIIDSEALALARDAGPVHFASWKISVVYAFFEGMTSAFWLLLYIVVKKKDRVEFFSGTLRRRSEMGRSVLMGIGIYVTYTIVLISMAFVRDVSYVVAFRQLSIPFGIVLSTLLLGERLYPPKAVGGIIMFSGLILVGVG